MLHRAIVGSMERFIGILLENCAGALSTWLAPVQAVVLSITDAQADYARGVMQALEKQGLRANVDLRGDKIGYKIREHSLQKIPYLVVVGEKEKQAGRVAVRARGGLDLGVMTLEELLERIDADVSSKGVPAGT
jgi:threonyl-tRNA synthetase